MEKWRDILLSAGGAGGRAQPTVGGYSRKMRKAKERDWMIKMNKMIKHENEKNQMSWNEGSHARGPRNKCCGWIPQTSPQTPADRRKDKATASAPKPSWKVTARSATGNIWWSWFCADPAHCRRWLVPWVDGSSAVSPMVGKAGGNDNGVLFTERLGWSDYNLVEQNFTLTYMHIL